MLGDKPGDKKENKVGDKLGDKGNKTSGRGAAHRPTQGNKKGDKRRHLTHHPTQAHVWGDNERQWETRGDKGSQGLFPAGRATGRLPHKETCQKNKTYDPHLAMKSHMTRETVN